MNPDSEQVRTRARVSAKRLMRTCQAVIVPVALQYGVEQTIPHLSSVHLGYLAQLAEIVDLYAGYEHETELKLLRQEAGLLPSDWGILSYLVFLHQFHKAPQEHIKAIMAYFDKQKDDEATEEMKPKELRKMLEKPMTAKRLRELLQEQNDDTIIVLAADEDGSVLSPLLAISDAAYIAKTAVTGEIKFRKDDEMTYLELRAAKLWHVDDVAKDGDGSVECVVLWPMRKMGDQ